MTYADLKPGQTFKDASKSVLIKIDDTYYNILRDKYGNEVKRKSTLKYRPPLRGYLVPIKIVKYTPQPLSLLKLESLETYQESDR